MIAAYFISDRTVDLLSVGGIGMIFLVGDQPAFRAMIDASRQRFANAPTHRGPDPWDPRLDLILKIGFHLRL